MTMNKRAWLAVTGVSLACFAPPAAEAATVFEENFQDTTAVPGRPNTPQVGAYPTDASTDPEATVILTGGSGHPAVGPTGDATNVLWINDKQRNYGTFTAPATTGQTVRFEWDALFDGGAALTFALMGDAGSLNLDGFLTSAIIQLNANGVIEAYKGGWNPIAGATHTDDAWQHYALEYVVGASTFTLTAGGNAPVVVSHVTVANEITHIGLTGGAGSTDGYIDNIVVTVVPEPASMALLALGGAVALAARRRA